MRKTLFTAAIMIVAIAFIATAADEPWFDLKKCAFCKTIADQPGLADHMKTEYHNLHNGTMSITHIDKEYQPAFAKAQESMKPVIADLQAGKPVYTCQHCTTLGTLMMGGVIPDQVKTGDDIIVVYTASDSTMVKKIQDFGQKSADAMAAMTSKAK